MSAKGIELQITYGKSEHTKIRKIRKGNREREREKRKREKKREKERERKREKEKQSVIT